MNIELPNRTIGQNAPTFIIAEIGSNFTDLEDCLLSIEQAASCGADAVKFQLYTHDALYGFNYPPPPENYNGLIKAIEYENCKTFNRKALNKEWLPQLKSSCDDLGVEFMCSAFSPELIEAVDPFVNIHKVASSELTHLRMLQKLKQLGKPVILSTGGAYVSEIRQALFALGNTTPIVLMYCVSAYPAHEVDLRTLKALHDTFGTIVGYSDHTTDVLMIPTLAIDLGACVIEKHVTFIDAVTPDSPHSLNVGQFKRMVEMIRRADRLDETAAEIGPIREELDMIEKHKRRLIVTHDVRRGDVLHEGVNYGIYRGLKPSLGAISPFDIGSVEGKHVLTDLAVGDAIVYGEFGYLE